MAKKYIGIRVCVYHQCFRSYNQCITYNIICNKNNMQTLQTRKCAKCNLFQSHSFLAQIWFCNNNNKESKVMKERNKELRCTQLQYIYILNIFVTIGMDHHVLNSRTSHCFKQENESKNMNERREKRASRYVMFADYSSKRTN